VRDRGREMRIVAAILVLVLAGYLWVQRMPIFGCHDEVAFQAWSPDGRHLAAIVIRDCGATTGLATHVVISAQPLRLPIGADEASCVFDDSSGVRLRWNTSNELKVHPGRGKAFRSEAVAMGVRITYSAD